MEKEVKHISEMPSAIADLLYEHRLKAHRNVPKEKYVGNYEFVSVDGKVAYISDRNGWRAKKWLNNHGLSCVLLPDAIVMGGILIKNRYGYATH